MRDTIRLHTVVLAIMVACVIDTVAVPVGTGMIVSVIFME